MQNAFLAGTIVAIMAGVIGYFVVLRRLAFATEALSHGGFAGATGAVLIGQDVFLGLLVFTSVAGVLMGLLGDKLRGRDVAIGATLAFSLALGSLFLTMSTKLAGEAVNILFGNILAIAPADVRLRRGASRARACWRSASMYRPLLFASLDPEIAEARGLPVRALGIAFMVLLGFAVATAVQVVGVLLIFALLILPAATAQQLTPRPPHAIALAVGDRRRVRLAGTGDRLLPAVSAQLFHHHAEFRRVPGGVTPLGGVRNCIALKRPAGSEPSRRSGRARYAGQDMPSPGDDRAWIGRLLPRLRYGVIVPGASAAIHRGVDYQFYRLVPTDVMQISVGIGIRDYSSDSVHSAMDLFWSCVQTLVDEGCSQVVLSGVPVLCRAWPRAGARADRGGPATPRRLAGCDARSDCERARLSWRTPDRHGQSLSRGDQREHRPLPGGCGDRGARIDVARDLAG